MSLNEAIKTIRDECHSHSDCIDCPLFDKWCTVCSEPYNWEEVDNGEE